MIINFNDMFINIKLNFLNNLKILEAINNLFMYLIIYEFFYIMNSNIIYLFIY